MRRDSMGTSWVAADALVPTSGTSAGRGYGEGRKSSADSRPVAFVMSAVEIEARRATGSAGELSERYRYPSSTRENVRAVKRRVAKACER
jgi:hypothetical protein